MRAKRPDTGSQSNRLSKLISINQDLDIDQIVNNTNLIVSDIHKSVSSLAPEQSANQNEATAADSAEAKQTKKNRKRQLQKKKRAAALAAARGEPLAEMNTSKDTPSQTSVDKLTQSVSNLEISGARDR